MRSTIRPARPGEHIVLSDLSLRSGQHWGYPDEFMAYEPESITVAPEHITDAITNVLDANGRVLGFYVLSGDPPEVELSRMFVEPDAIGTGCGRRLWEHMVETARGLGVEVITLDADPNAEPFYQHMGAATVTELIWVPPMMPGWHLKQMRFTIPRAARHRE